MAVYKCKMCGGELHVREDRVAFCGYCGTKQTLPRLDSAEKENLYDRASHFRRNNEFDKATAVYEQILTLDNTDAESYWSLVLCRYGIEYVEDPDTGKRIPTVNRAQFTSVYDDDNYKCAINYADPLSKAVYEDEARKINEIQKGILAISNNEKPFDVFICYKETDSSGRRTHDSVLATELYHELTNEGFRVFFSKITLEDKLGTAYEPYIFAALNSSKVMVVLGTKAEYFNAVWVKNEWSRFLSLIKNGEKKILIPAYKNMVPYDLPEEFSHLQAQDMNKLGFMQDIIRGIKKMVQPEAKKEIIPEINANINTPVTNTVPLLKRAFMFLEDGDWESADEYCEKVLDIDPENAQAYLGKLLSELRVKKQETLKEQEKPFDHSNNYQKAIRFADDKLKTALTGYIEYINIRNENARLVDIYTRAKNAMSASNTESEYKEAAHLFETISEYQDSAVLAQLCYEKAEIARKEAERIAKRNKKIAIITTPIVCAIIAFIIVLITVIIPNGKYNDAIALMDAGEYTKAISAFKALDGYKDSLNKIFECNTAILYNEAIALMDAGNIVEAYEALAALDGYKDSTDKANSIYDKYKVEKLKVAKVGDYVFFGAYEQDNNTSNGKEHVEWLVLDVKDGKALVISKYALDCKPYNTSYTDVTWETCTLRKWLNNDFINATFSADEKAMIPTVTVSADKNPEYSTNPGKATQDQVFLLSITEENKYFSSDSARQCDATDYAVANGVNGNSDCYWWLRSPGADQNRATIVYTYSYVHEFGISVNNDDLAVRPALWIDLTS